MSKKLGISTESLLIKRGSKMNGGYSYGVHFATSIKSN